MGKFYNKQQVGLRIKELKIDEQLKKWITPLATFKDSGKATWSIVSWSDDASLPKSYKHDEEFIAIAEGISIPIYFFTYNIEMT